MGRDGETCVTHLLISLSHLESLSLARKIDRGGITTPSAQPRISVASLHNRFNKFFFLVKITN